MSWKSYVVPVVSGLVLMQAAWAGPDGWERGSAYNKIFNPKTIVTVEGTVEKVDRDNHPLQGMEPGFAVTLKTAKGEKVDAQVGPIWFTSFFTKKWNAQVGDKVSVTGSEVSVGGKKVLMVIQGKKGDLQMTVRNKSGVPVWDLGITDF